jgi:hypothetical protein
MLPWVAISPVLELVHINMEIEIAAGAWMITLLWSKTCLSPTVLKAIALFHHRY